MIYFFIDKNPYFIRLMSKFSLSEHREKYGKYAYKMMLVCIGLKTHNNGNGSVYIKKFLQDHCAFTISLADIVLSQELAHVSNGEQMGNVCNSITVT